MRITLSLLWALGIGIQAGEYPEKIQFHEDRNAPRLIVNPIFKSMPGETPTQIANRFVRVNWQRFQLSPDGANLVLGKVVESLLGKHVHLQQMLNGYEVEGAEIIVSIQPSGRVYRVLNNTYPLNRPLEKAPPMLLDVDDALDVSWHHLGVYGGLRTLPDARRVYLPQNGDFRLIYRVSLPVDGPFGAWSLAVDAVSGEVLSARDAIVYHGPKKLDAFPHPGQLSDREFETGRIRAQIETKKGQGPVRGKRAKGRAIVFDPDPKTTLMDETLEDNSADSRFTDAYVERELPEILQNESTGQFELKGPWCEVAALTSQFTAPNTPPSTTSDGFWDFRRGNNGFNDAMTYFHIDQNQRYIQSLGFTGTRGLQNVPIQVDTDGVSGQDQSFYDPSVNALVFGHGCVDDNEDADVILHEYMHGLQVFVNNFYGSGGDEGAMGEGFADYWAGSYSLKTPNGPLFHPEWMFSWDGHNFCWDGRLMNQTQAVYVPGRTYGAHEPLGSYNADELWATPLFQAMFQLFRQGIPISESDRIILESNFGLNFGMNMPATAEIIVNTAETMYPNGPHAQVFKTSLGRHNILDPNMVFRYIAAHVPPNRSSMDWQSEIQIINANKQAAAVVATVYEDQGDGTVAATQTNMEIDPFATQAFVPGGTQQRWVLFESDLPLSGTLFFTRTNDVLGSERAGIPLFADTETAGELILPHVPADRASFWSGAVVVNPENANVALEIELIGDAGNDLTHLLSPGTPTELAPRQKWVTFLTEGPGGIPGIFDDSNSEEKVSYVKFSAGNQIAGFQLYGYNAVDGEVATSGIMAHPDQSRTHFPVRVALTSVDFSGFSVLNPTDQSSNFQVTAIGKNGSVMAEAEGVLPARSKLLGLNTAGGGFNFPSTGAPLISVADGNQLQTVLITAAEPLRVFELNGDFDNTQLDGAAVLGLTTNTYFANPKGELEISKFAFEGNVTITARFSNGAPVEETFFMAAGETITLTVTNEDVTSLQVKGEMFTAALVDQDLDNRSLAVISGKQVEYNPNGQE